MCPMSPLITAAVPPDQQCKLPGCTRVRYAEPGGRVHEFCGRTHAAMRFSGLAVGPGDFFKITVAKISSSIAH